MASSLTIFLLVSHLFLILVSFVSGLFISFSDCIAYGCAGWHASTIFLPHFLLHMGHVRVLRRVRYDIPSFGWLPRLGRDLTADDSLVFQFFLFLLFLLILYLSCIFPFLYFLFCFILCLYFYFLFYTSSFICTSSLLVNTFLLQHCPSFSTFSCIHCI